MATKSITFPTLADHAKRLDPDGKIATIVELLSQTNPVLQDMTFVEGNLPTGHRSTVRTGLPSVYWRALNQGVPSSKSTTAQTDDTCGMLEAYAEVDKALATLNDNTSEFRLSEDRAFLEAMNQAMGETVFYGDPSTDPRKFLGLSSRYGDMTAGNAQNIIQASNGTSTNNTSIWLIGWGDQTVHGIFPKGSKAGLDHEDLGEQTLFDSAGGKYQGYRTHYVWRNGLTVRDWRYAVRIPNIDVSKLKPGDTETIDLIKLMIKSLHCVPNLKMGKFAFYCNRTVAEYLDIQSIEKSALALKVQELEGQFWTAFRGIPIRSTDALISGEEGVLSA